MARIVNLGLLSLVIISLVGTTEASPKEVTDPATTVLRDNWFIQPSADVHADGADNLERWVFHARLVSRPRCPQR